MRRSTFPPRTPKADAAAMRAPEPPKRKVFYCIADDTALMAGVKKSTRDGIRKWIATGAICLYVPLHTLTQLQRLKTGSDRANAESREAMKWLDEITSVPGDVASRVRLQGGEEEYATWAEAEKFLLPEPLLSMEESESDEDEDDYHEDLESSFNALDVSDETSMSSTHSTDDALKTPESPRSCLSRSIRAADEAEHKDKAAAMRKESPDRTARNSHELPRTEKAPKGSVPVHLQPLFNHILWRINTAESPDAALESFILLTNDPAKQVLAQKFGIRAKRLEQLRDAVAREDREYRNHMTIFELENKDAAPKAAERPKSSYVAETKPVDNSDDEDVVLFQRAPRGPAAQKNQQVIDPNDFARTSQNHAPRGGRGGYVPSRGRGGMPPFRGRGGFAPRGAYVPPGPAFRAPAPAPRHDPTQPLDPDSFTRPAPRATPARGGGHGRKLWEPN